MTINMPVKGQHIGTGAVYKKTVFVSALSVHKGSTGSDPGKWNKT